VPHTASVDSGTRAWEWSDNVATMHGYHPGGVVPTTELLLSHKHPDDRHYVAQTLDAIRTSGGPFSSRHRIIDTHGVTRSVVVVGESIEGEHGEVTAPSRNQSTNSSTRSAAPAQRSSKQSEC